METIRFGRVQVIHTIRNECDLFYKSRDVAIAAKKPEHTQRNMN